MESPTLQLLATALGLAALSGINLYLTVFALSLALNCGWITLAPEYAALQVIDHPAILITAGVLYFFEFFADKVPWVDSLWDSVHTAIRPLGATLLGLTVLGTPQDPFTIVAALLCGGVALTTHTTKAGIRLLVNASPEPVSNIAVSTAEDVLVIGGLALIHTHPILSLILVLIFVVAFVIFVPRIATAALTTLRYLYFKVFKFGVTDTPATPLGNTLPPAERELLESHLQPAEGITWAVPVQSGRNKKLPRNRSGFLVLLEESSRIGLILKGRPPVWASTRDLEVHEARYALYDELSIYSRATKTSLTARFFKHETHTLQKVAQYLRNLQTNPAKPAA
jgi:hypothetical protein